MRRSEKAPHAERILVLRYRFIGDTILAVPFLRNLRRAYPDAKIDVLVGPESGNVLDGCPYVDELIEFDTTRFHKYDRGRGARRSFWSYVSFLRRRRYDTAFILKRSFSSAALAFLIGCRHRIGYDTEGRRLLLTTPVPFDPGRHEVESLLDVLRAACLPVEDNYLEAFISEAETQLVKKMVPALKEPGRKVIFHAAAAHPDKMYPLENWADLIAKMVVKHKVTPYFVGSGQDVLLYEKLLELSQVKGVNLAGVLSLRQTMALLSQMDLAICTDSGPAHLAAAVGTPTLALFGPTDPERWRPWGWQHAALFDEKLECRPCHYKKTCEDRPCLTALAPERVMAAAEQLMAEQVLV